MGECQMIRISYYKRTHYNNRIERYYDPEWEKAEKADERPVYWWVSDCFGKRYVKKYKPSLADLVAKRTGWKMVKIDGGE